MTSIGLSGRTEKQHYNRSNPPPNVQDALARLESLADIIAEIEAKLDLKEPADFPTDSSYKAWYNRARVALGYHRQEEKFLETWFRSHHGNPVLRSQKPRPSRGNLGSIDNRIRIRAQQMADRIDREYMPLYSQATPPPTVEAARERQVFVSGVKQKLQLAFTEITAEWTRYPLGRQDLSGVKSPLHRILTEVETEMVVLREFLIDCRQAQNAPIQKNWKAICVEALDRAVASGFQLTPEETLVLDSLRIRFGKAKSVARSAPK